ncbi:uncharacterized protein si:ch73-70k4.1 [Syngnathoides biaculeatus]|uniref:uncharacterized protein si:ch73-70k4.1 n=1 Tax=Syngnathoides biaculeatus TaxID=300417 RepID=UPI002ADD5177|nr:uncharacterized protein si:ch73-70k4.1 [Syngnathoides biaculeatus]
MAAGSSPSSSVNKRKYFIGETTEVTDSGSPEMESTAAKKTNVTRSKDCGSPWWTKKDLPAGEALWALTLQASLPYLNEQHWEDVPDLPHPSATETSHELDQHQWCELNREVPPFPEPHPVSQETSSKQNKARPEIADISLSSLIRQDHDGYRVTIKSGSQKDQTFPHAIAGPSHAIAGPSRVEGEGLKQDEKRPTPQVSCNQSLHQKERINEEPMETEDDQGEKCSDTKRAEEELNSCPMCLHVFSDGASQMDRDGHLAQCLSEMNVDMSW